MSRLAGACGFLALGFIAAVAVSYACNYADAGVFRPADLDAEGRAAWARVARDGWPAEPASVKTARGALRSVRLYDAYRSGPPPVFFNLWVVRTGWPLPAFAHEQLWDGLDGMGFRHYPGGVPARPLWPGLIADTLLYAGAAALAWALAGAVRSRMKRRGA